jgi:hypothetical protein
MAPEKLEFKNIQEIVNALDGTQWKDDDGRFQNTYKFYKQQGRFYYLCNLNHPVEFSCRNDNGVFVCDGYQWGTRIIGDIYTFHIHNDFKRMDMLVKQNKKPGIQKRLLLRVEHVLEEK